MSVTQVFGTFILPQGGGNPIYFDAVITETVTRDADITEFPVEVGANIVDHYRLKLNSIKLEVFVSQEPLYPALHPEGSGFYGAQSLSWQPYPTPGTDINGNISATAEISNVAGAVLNPAGALSKLLNADPTTMTRNGVLQWPNLFDSLESLMTTLEGLRNTAAIVDVCTRSIYYQGYMLGQIETARDKESGTGTKVSIELHQINTVATQQVTGTQIPPLPKKPKDTPPVNKGMQQPTDPGDYTSQAKALGNLFATIGAP